jgi:hypothetical protein
MSSPLIALNAVWQRISPPLISKDTPAATQGDLQAIVDVGKFFLRYVYFEASGGSDNDNEHEDNDQNIHVKYHLTTSPCSQQQPAQTLRRNIPSRTICRGCPADIRCACTSVPAPQTRGNQKNEKGAKEISCEMMSMEDLKRLRGEL